MPEFKTANLTEIYSGISRNGFKWKQSRKEYLTYIQNLILLKITNKKTKVGNLFFFNELSSEQAV